MKNSQIIDIKPVTRIIHQRKPFDVSNEIDSLSSANNGETEYSISLNTKINKLNSIISNLLILSSITLTIFFIIIGLSIFSTINQTKSEIIDKSLSALDNIEAGFLGLAELNVPKANKYFDYSNKDLTIAKAKLSKIEPLAISASVIPMVPNYYQTAKSILEIENSSLEIGQSFSGIIEKFYTTTNDNQENYKNTVSQNYKNISEELSLIEKNIYKIDKKLIPKVYQDKIESFKQKVTIIKKYVLLTEDIAKEMPDILGMYQEKNYLLLLQNNRELRSTGGFIGSFGIASFDKAFMKNFYIKDIYELDDKYSKAVKDGKTNYLNPPYPMNPATTGNWTLRDANLNPDFEEAQKDILNLYYKEIKFSEEKYPLKIDGVIAINTSLLEDVIKVFGEIRIDKYDMILDGKNTLETLQLEIEAGQDKKNNKNPKNILGALNNELMKNISTSDNDKRRALVETVLRNLDEKNIIIFLDNLKMEVLLKDLGWAGEIIETNQKQDYLMIVNNNFGGGKSSQEIEEKITQTIKETEDGKIQKELSIKRTHTSDYRFPYTDPWTKEKKWLIGRNNNYIKIYVPKGSRLIKAEGFGDKIDIFNENDKTVFGGWFSLNPIEEKTVSVEYELPFRLSSFKEYQINLQKQPGSNRSYIETYFQIHDNSYQFKTNLSQKNLFFYGPLNMDKFIYLK